MRSQRTIHEQARITGAPQDDPEYQRLAAAADEAKRDYDGLKRLLNHSFPHVNNVPQPVDDGVIILKHEAGQRYMAAARARDNYAVQASGRAHDYELQHCDDEDGVSPKEMRRIMTEQHLARFYSEGNL